MSRRLVLAAVTALLATGGAEAGWRDYAGKTLIVEVKTSGRNVNDVITARGGASVVDDVSNSQCDMTYRLYLSGKGRLFMYLSRIACDGADPYRPDAPSGTIIDLTMAAGQVDGGESSPRTPYSLRVEGEEVVIDQPQTDYVWNSSGSVTTFSNSSGSYATRIRFAEDCAMSASGSASYRMEYRSTDSDYYTLQDSSWTYDLKSVSCRVVEGFQ